MTRSIGRGSYTWEITRGSCDPGVKRCSTRGDVNSVDFSLKFARLAGVTQFYRVGWEEATECGQLAPN